MRRKASLLVHEKAELPGGFIVEIKIWRLPAMSEERPHGLKYSLFFGLHGQRLVAYDNEAGKGDHRHLREIEEPYRFRSMDGLVEDFWHDVEEEYARWTN